MTQPQISGNQIWWNHERRVLRVLERALQLLTAEEDLDVREDSLNWKLSRCIRTANAELLKLNEGTHFPIVCEARNQPDPDDEQRAKREDKRPDFQCGFVDDSEQDPQRQYKFYVIECKRLGTAEGKSWIFNKNYIVHGILRFIAVEHGYGKSVESGAMVGYLRSMASKDILNEVNGHATKANLHGLVLSGDGWVDRGVSRLEQTLDRPAVPPTPFSLRHLWVDLRQN